MDDWRQWGGVTEEARGSVFTGTAGRQLRSGYEEVTMGMSRLGGRARRVKLRRCRRQPIC